MYVHLLTNEDRDDLNLSCDELSVSESAALGPENILNFLRPGKDKALTFVTEKCVSAAQYACWHRIVKEHLMCNKNSDHAIKELATTCIREIENVHNFSESL
jgi:hypothetical protein